MQGVEWMANLLLCQVAMKPAPAPCPPPPLRLPSIRLHGRSRLGRDGGGRLRRGRVHLRRRKDPPQLGDRRARLRFGRAHLESGLGDRRALLGDGRARLRSVELGSDGEVGLLVGEAGPARATPLRRL